MQTAKLLQLNTYHYRRGGSDAVYFEHDALFRALGWETAAFAMHHPRNEPSPWSRFFVNELEFGSDYGAWQKLLMAGKVIYSLEARHKLNQLLEAFQPDIAHAHCIYHHLSPSVLVLLRERGIPTVMTAHDLKLACPAYKMLNQGGVCERCKGGNLLHLALNRCLHGSLAVSALVMLESALHRLFGLYRKTLDRVVVPSEFFRHKLMEWGWPREQLAYIPNFVRVEHYTPEYRPGDYLLYFGRLAPEKGVDTLIRAVRQLGVRLRIAGTGPDEQKLRQLANGASNIEFLGYCPQSRLSPEVQGARAVVLPSQWYENAPMSVLEAYAQGKVVIGARMGGIPEMLREGETGFLFESGEVHPLAEVLERVYALPEVLLEEMGRWAREYVETTFTPRRYREDMLQLYRSLGVEMRTAPGRRARRYGHRGQACKRPPAKGGSFR
jgi:glycosyltransferase involved in cell wall biosynthesis